MTITIYSSMGEEVYKETIKVSCKDGLCVVDVPGTALTRGHHCPEPLQA